MERYEIEKMTRTIFAKHKKIDESMIRGDTDLAIDLKFDSLDIVDCLMDIEDITGKEIIETNKYQRERTFDDLIDYLDKQINKPDSK